jgi:cytochrome c peroxidase
MKKSIPILIFTSVVATATFFSCKKNEDLTNPEVGSGGTEYLEMPAEPYKYSNGFSGTTNHDQKAALGRVLFYDKHLSINNSVSCASCHKQAFAFADNVAQSRGFENRLTSRNSMPLENLPSTGGFGGGASFNLFWDGRSSSLNDLILRPVGNHVEMGISDLESLTAKLSELDYYDKLFLDAYGDETVTLSRISESMSLFLEAIRADNSKLDKQQRGEKVMNAQELYGMTLFDSKYNCRSCHTLSPVSVYYGGAGTSNFLNIGLDPNVGAATDKGRGVISGDPADNGKFRVPNLHNVALTAPYMHDGRYETLEDVIDHYSHNIQNTSNLDSRLRGPDGQPLHMNIDEQDKKALIAFLNTLTDAEMIVDPRFSNPFKIK